MNDTFITFMQTKFESNLEQAIESARVEISKIENLEEKEAAIGTVLLYFETILRG